MKFFQRISQRIKDLLDPPDLRKQYEQTHAQYKEAREKLQQKMDDTNEVAEVTRVGVVRNER